VPVAIRRINGLRLLALVAGVLLVLGVGSAFGYRALRDSSLFAVHDVVVTGANPALAAQVQTAVRASAGERGLLALSPGNLARAIEVVPGVHAARVDRDFPSTLRVTIWPEEAVALGVHGHDRVVLSASGRVLARIDNRAKPPSLPRVPLAHAVPKPGAQILDPEVLSQIRAVDAIPQRFGGRVAWSKLDPNHGLELQLNWPKLWIRLGPAVDLQQKLRAAALVLRAYPSVAARQGLSYVDVSAPARPAVMPVTPDPATTALAQPDTETDPAAGTGETTDGASDTNDAATASASANP
jgi:cell division septal protein FtsQ